MKTDNEEDDFESKSSTPTSLPEHPMGKTASFYPVIKTSMVWFPAPARDRGNPPPQVMMTTTNFNAEQLRQMSLEYGKKLTEDWIGIFLPGGIRKPSTCFTYLTIGKQTEKLQISSPGSSANLPQEANIFWINTSKSPCIPLIVIYLYSPSFVMDMGASISMIKAEDTPGLIQKTWESVPITRVEDKRQECSKARIKLILPNDRIMSPLVVVEPLSILSMDLLKSQTIKTPLGTWVPNRQTQVPVISVDEILAGGSPTFLLQFAPKLSKSTSTHVQQYLVLLESSQGITTLMKDLKWQGIFQKTCSLYTSPIWSVHKFNDTWCLMVDYHKLNETIEWIEWKAALTCCCPFYYKSYFCYTTSDSSLDNFNFRHKLLSPVIYWINCPGESSKKRKISMCITNTSSIMFNHQGNKHLISECRISRLPNTQKKWSNLAFYSFRLPCLQGQQPGTHIIPWILVYLIQPTDWQFHLNEIMSWAIFPQFFSFL